MSNYRIAVICADADRLTSMAEGLAQDGEPVFPLLMGQEKGLPDTIAYPVIFVMLKGFRDPMLVEVLERVSQQSYLILSVPKCGLADMVELLNIPRVHHVATGDECLDDFKIIAAKILSGDIFGIEHYLPKETTVHRIRLRSFKERQKVIGAIVDFAEASSVRRQIRGSIAQVCEELLMNALYDAPVDDEGTLLFKEVTPKERTKMESPEPASIRCAVTPSQFVVSVRDRFGRLNKETLLAVLKKCLTEERQIDDKNVGAGLGLYFVANHSSRYVVNVADNMATEVVCTFDTNKRSPIRLIGHFVHGGTAQS